MRVELMRTKDKKILKVTGGRTKTRLRKIRLIIKVATIMQLTS